MRVDVCSLDAPCEVDFAVVSQEMQVVLRQALGSVDMTRESLIVEFSDLLENTGRQELCRRNILAMRSVSFTDLKSFESEYEDTSDLICSVAGVSEGIGRFLLRLHA